MQPPFSWSGYQYSHMFSQNNQGYQMYPANNFPQNIQQTYQQDQLMFLKKISNAS